MQTRFNVLHAYRRRADKEEEKGHVAAWCYCDMRYESHS